MAWWTELFSVATGALFIRILEYNDQAPYFEFPFYVLNVTEELPLASVVGSLLALDEDDDIRAYQLVDNPGDLFSISINSGVCVCVCLFGCHLDHYCNQSASVCVMN